MIIATFYLISNKFISVRYDETLMLMRCIQLIRLICCDADCVSRIYRVITRLDCNMQSSLCRDEGNLTTKLKYFSQFCLMIMNSHPFSDQMMSLKWSKWSRKLQVIIFIYISMGIPLPRKKKDYIHSGCTDCEVITPIAELFTRCSHMQCIPQTMHKTGAVLRFKVVGHWPILYISCRIISLPYGQSHILPKRQWQTTIDISKHPYKSTKDYNTIKI